MIGVLRMIELNGHRAREVTERARASGSEDALVKTVDIAALQRSIADARRDRPGNSRRFVATR